MSAAAIKVSPELVRHFTGHGVLCLHSICQPLVDEMQAVILYQQDQLDRAVKAMDHSIRTQGDNLLPTQQFTLFTNSIAEIKGEDVDALRDKYLPGSAAMHRRDEE